MKVIVMKVTGDGDNEKFDVRAEQYGSFVKTLVDQFPTLSHVEIETLVYFKAGLEAKEIAAMEGITKEYARKKRHRLKSKLGIVGKMDLQEFVESDLINK